MAKILIILEEDIFLGNVINDKIKKEGFETLFITNGEIGIEQMESFKPDLLILDMELKTVNSYKVLEEKKNKAEIAPISTIIISASGDVDEIKKVLDLGVKDYIVKSQFNAGELIAKIKNIISSSSKSKKTENHLEGKKVILLCGYFRPSKGFHTIIDIFPDICKVEPNAALVVAGKTRNIEYDEYRRKLFTTLNESPAADQIMILRGQFPQHTFDTIISAADVVALPYEIGSQSGMMAQCFAQSVPVVTSSLQAFKLIIERSKGGLVAKSTAEYKKHILSILNNDKLRSGLRTNIRKYVKDTAGWSKIALKHSDVYHGIVTTPYGKAKHVYFPDPEG